MPEAASLHNPIDVVGDAPASRYHTALSAVLKDAKVDAVIVILTHQYITETEKIAQIIIALNKKFKKPLFVSFIGGGGVEKGRAILVRYGIPEFSFPEQAVRALDASWKAKEAKNLTTRFPDVEIKKDAHIVPLVGLKAETLLKKYIPFVLRSHISVSIPNALLQAKKIGYPVVAKVASASFLHKTEAGFVRVNIGLEKDLLHTLLSWKKKIKSEFKKGEGFVVQAYRPAQLEVFLGAKRDPHFGPYLVCGVGGIFVEQLALTRIFSLPLTFAQAHHILKVGVLGTVLTSERGKRLPIASLAKSVVGLSRMMIERADIAECDLNPVLVRTDGVYIPDVRILKTGA
jgi:acetyltransferase